MHPKNEVYMSRNNKQWLGLPLHLIWGYIAIAVLVVTPTY